VNLNQAIKVNQAQAIKINQAIQVNKNNQAIDQLIITILLAIINFI
jgi:hypothetical protein